MKLESVTGRIRRCSISSRIPRRSRTASSSSAGPACRSSQSSTGTPLYVYCEETLRARAREIRAAVPGALVFYGSKAFPNVAIMRLFAEEGLGADVVSLGELAFARAAGIDGTRLFVHGNAKSDEELRAACGRRRNGRARRRGRAGARGSCGRRARARPGDPRRRGGYARGDPDGSPRLEVRTARRCGDARCSSGLCALGLDVAGLHVHVGSQLADTAAHAETIEPPRARSRRAAATSSAGRPASSTSAAASPFATSSTSPRRRSASSHASVADGVARAWERARPARSRRSCSSRVARSSGRPA